MSIPRDTTCSSGTVSRCQWTGSKFETSKLDHFASRVNFPSSLVDRTILYRSIVEGVPVSKRKTQQSLSVLLLGSREHCVSRIMCIYCIEFASQGY